MCKPLSEGGARCPAHHYGTMVMKQTVKSLIPRMPEQQTNYTFSHLRMTAVSDDREPPTEHEYLRFLNKVERQVNRLSASGYISDREVTKVKNRIQKAIENKDQLPDGQTFYAMRHMINANRSVWRNIASDIIQISNATNTPRTSVLRAFNTNLENTPRTSMGSYEDAYSPRVSAALQATRIGTMFERESTPRIEREELESGPLQSIGYDPVDGRVEFADREGREYAFHSVTEEDYQRLRENPAEEAGRLYNSKDHAYSDQDTADADKYRVWCERCQRHHIGNTKICEGGTPEKVALPGRDDRISSLYKKIIDDFHNQNDSAEPEIQDNPFTTGEYELSEPDLGEDGYEQGRGSRRRGGETNSKGYGLSNDGVRAVRRELEKGKKVRVEVGRDVAIAGTNGERFHHVRVPVDITPTQGNMFGDPNFRWDEAKCDCSAYRRNGDCKHLHPNVDDPEQVNQFVRKDAEMGLNGIEMNRFTSPVHHHVRLDENDNVPEPMVHYINQQMLDPSRRTTVIFYAYEDGYQMGHLSLDETGFSTNLSMDASRPFSWAGEASSRQSTANSLAGWELNDDERAHYYSRYGTDAEASYFHNTRMFLDDYEEAKRTRNQPLPVEYGSVTNGFLSTSGDEPNARGFGVEIEFSNADLDTVADALNEAGLSDSDYAHAYHSEGYDSWKVEDDCSVGGEVVSPILYDNEESWRQVEKACQIIREHGGEATAMGGGHVHIGVPHVNNDIIRKTFSATVAHQDVIRRLSTDPNRGTHRTTHSNDYTQPFREDHVSRVYGQNYNLQFSLGRSQMMNFGNDNTMEFRDPDGSIDPGHIQTQVMMASALVRSGEQGQWDDMNERNTSIQRIGTNRTRQPLIDRVDSSDEDKTLASEVSLISTLDTLFPDRESRKRMLNVAVRNEWQSPGSFF